MHTYREACKHALRHIHINYDTHTHTHTHTHTLAQTHTMNMKNYNKLVNEIRHI